MKTENAAARATRLVVVVDDDDAVRAFLGEIFRRRGHEVMTAGNAGQAALLLSSLVPDAVLLDLQLPDVNGIGLLRWIRERTTYDSTRVLIVSGDEGQCRLARAMEIGANGVFEKPIETERLVEAVERAGAV